MNDASFFIIIRILFLILTHAPLDDFEQNFSADSFSFAKLRLSDKLPPPRVIEKKMNKKKKIKPFNTEISKGTTYLLSITYCILSPSAIIKRPGQPWITTQKRYLSKLLDRFIFLSISSLFLCTKRVLIGESLLFPSYIPSTRSFV